MNFEKELEKLEMLDANIAAALRKMKPMFPFISVNPENDLYIYTRTFFKITAKYPYMIRHTQHDIDGLCLLYTVDGEGLLTLTDNTQFHLTAGKLCFYPQAMTSNLKIIAPHWEHYLLIINGNELLWFYTKLRDALNASAGLLETKYTKIPLMLSAYEYRQDFSKNTDMYNLSYTTALLSELITLAVHAEPKPDIPEYLQSIRLLFDEKYSNYYSLDFLEKQYKINKYRIAKEFTHYYGIAPISYLNRRRIEAAKGLLLSTNKKIHEIAGEVGYENPTHFINAFKKQTGMTPLIFRKVGVHI